MSTPPPDPATSSHTGSDVLACGADTDVLLAQVAEGRGGERDAHQAGCPHCGATLAEYTRLWAPFDALAATAVVAPPAVMDHALATIRRHAGPVGWGRVTDDGGSFLVAARVVVAVAGHAARTSPGVRMALGALGQVTDGQNGPGPDLDAPDALASTAAVVDAGVSGRSVAVELTVAAEYGHDLHALAAHLRRRVRDEVAAQTGLDVVEVDVAVTDVFTPRRS